MARSPAQIFVLAAVLGVGALLSAWILGRLLTQVGHERGLGQFPDITLRGATTATLTAAGFRWSGQKPQSWHSIDLRMFGDIDNNHLFLQCHINAHEAAALFSFTQLAARPIDNAPPPNWTKVFARDIPDWWRPNATQARVQEQRGPTTNDKGKATGLYAAYDPTRQQLWAWRWTASATTVPIPSPRVGPDQVVVALAGAWSRLAPVGGDWLIVEDVELPAGDYVASLTALTKPSTAALRASLAVRSRSAAHRFFLRLGPLSEAAAVTLLDDRALAPGPGATLAAPTLPDWPHALAPPLGLLRDGDPHAVPGWFNPGPGPRWYRDTATIGSGAIIQARWAAYDPRAATLFVWDWNEPAAPEIGR